MGIIQLRKWSLISELEGVQRRSTRLIDEVGTLPYSEKLVIVSLATLAEHRIRGDLIMQNIQGCNCLTMPRLSFASKLVAWVRVAVQNKWLNGSIMSTFNFITQQPSYRLQ